MRSCFVPALTDHESGDGVSLLPKPQSVCTRVRTFTYEIPVTSGRDPVTKEWTLYPRHYVTPSMSVYTE